MLQSDVDSPFYQIRKAQPSDACAFYGLWQEIYSEVTELVGQPPPPKQLQVILQRIHQLQLPLLLILYKDQLIGSISVFPQNLFVKAETMDSTTAEVSIMLAARFRGQGLAEKMIYQALDQARILQFEKLVANIYPENKASLQLARRFNFQRQTDLGCGKQQLVLNLSDISAAQDMLD